MQQTEHCWKIKNMCLHKSLCFSLKMQAAKFYFAKTTLSDFNFSVAIPFDFFYSIFIREKFNVGHRYVVSNSI